MTMMVVGFSVRCQAFRFALSRTFILKWMTRTLLERMICMKWWCQTVTWGKFTFFLCAILSCCCMSYLRVYPHQMEFWIRARGIWKLSEMHDWWTRLTFCVCYEYFSWLSSLSFYDCDGWTLEKPFSQLLIYRRRFSYFFALLQRETFIFRFRLVSTTRVRVTKHQNSEVKFLNMLTAEQQSQEWWISSAEIEISPRKMQGEVNWHMETFHHHTQTIVDSPEKFHQFWDFPFDSSAHRRRLLATE